MLPSNLGRSCFTFGNFLQVFGVEHTDAHLALYTRINKINILHLGVVLSPRLQQSVDRAEEVETVRNRDQEADVDAQHRLQPLGVRGVVDTAASDVLLQHPHQGQHSLGWQPADRVVDEGEVGSVQHRVEDPLITGVETLDQELGQRVSPATNQESEFISYNNSQVSIDKLQQPITSQYCCV